MRGSRAAVGLLLLLPAAAAAGRIRVRLDTQLVTPADDPWVARPLTASSPAGPVAVDPAAPVAVSLLRIAPPDLPSDTPGNPYQGTATYYRSEYFTLTARLTDELSGESGAISYGGRLHANYAYAGHDAWAATAYAWLDAGPQNITLGGNWYTLNPQGGRYWGVSGGFELYVGGLAPQPLPEPGTLVLAGIGLAPVVWRFRRPAGFLLTHT